MGPRRTPGAAASLAQPHQAHAVASSIERKFGQHHFFRGSSALTRAGASCSAVACAHLLCARRRACQGRRGGGGCARPGPSPGASGTAGLLGTGLGSRKGSGPPPAAEGSEGPPWPGSARDPQLAGLRVQVQPAPSRHGRPPRSRPAHPAPARASAPSGQAGLQQEAEASPALCTHHYDRDYGCHRRALGVRRAQRGACSSCSARRVGGSANPGMPGSVWRVGGGPSRTHFTSQCPLLLLSGGRERHTASLPPTPRTAASGPPPIPRACSGPGAQTPGGGRWAVLLQQGQPEHRRLGSGETLAPPPSGTDGAAGAATGLAVVRGGPQRAGVRGCLHDGLPGLAPQGGAATACNKTGFILSRGSCARDSDSCLFQPFQLHGQPRWRLDGGLGWGGQWGEGRGAPGCGSAVLALSPGPASVLATDLRSPRQVSQHQTRTWGSALPPPRTHLPTLRLPKHIISASPVNGFNPHS